LLGILIFKLLTARLLYKSFWVKGLTVVWLKHHGIIVPKDQNEELKMGGHGSSQNGVPVDIRFLGATVAGWVAEGFS
jgi:hypothetical protein